MWLLDDYSAKHLALINYSSIVHVTFLPVWDCNIPWLIYLFKLLRSCLSEQIKFQINSSTFGGLTFAWSGARTLSHLSFVTNYTTWWRSHLSHQLQNKLLQTCVTRHIKYVERQRAPVYGPICAIICPSVHRQSSTKPNSGTVWS